MIFSVLTGLSIDKLEFKIEWKSRADGKYAFGCSQAEADSTRRSVNDENTLPCSEFNTPFLLDQRSRWHGAKLHAI